MAHRGLFSGAVVSKAPKKKPTKKPVSQSVEPPKPKDPPKPKWGTPEEKYRRLCMLCLLCRMTYYIHAKSIVSDQTYDELERTILQIEDKHRDLLHPRSPTNFPGSSRVEDYPRSAQDLWEMHKDDRDDVWKAIEQAVVSFTKEARQEFGLNES